MNRASPSDMRKALEAVSALVSAGILFVSMPVSSTEERDNRIKEGAERLEQMAKDAELGGITE